ncbi:TRAF3-interacting protein 1-like isoform X2 [Babylonia areolata]|uniref:TRAF3-interacting protein 1-like isoform X2 n=1 Tax=Babylonia areolata TaxID=304850 RepID=UPI003FD1D949
MDPGVLKKTQDTLGKIIKKPPLTEKLLGKPPFRFLHDVMTSVIKTTGFMKGLYTDSDMNSENVKEKEAKIAFLQKAIDMVAAVTGQSVAAKPAKIVAGHEPERTNEFLQALAAAINANVDNDDYVKRVLSGGGGGGGEGKKEKGDKEDKKDKDRTRSASRRKDDDKRRKEDKEKSHDRDKDRGEKRHKEREGGEGHEDKDKHRDRREKSRDREDRHRDKDRERRKKKEVEEKENESPERNGEKDSQETPSRLQRPTSAKGSRRRRQDDEEFQQRESQEPSIGANDLPPQVTAARKMARPPSARPAPPRPKQEGVEAEPAMRLGTGAPTNVIVDDGKQSDDEDENFLVEESAPPPPAPEPVSTQAEAEDDTEHGALVKKMLESKKEAEQQQQPAKKTEIERPALSDAQRRKQRELVSKEIERLQTSIQSLTRSANPLGKIMDYVQEDMDSMQKELDRWRSENKEHALALRRERNVTDRAIEPLKAQLADLDRAITDQLDLIAASKSNIMRSDHRIQKMLHSIARS